MKKYWIYIGLVAAVIGVTALLFIHKDNGPGIPLTDK